MVTNEKSELKSNGGEGYLFAKRMRVEERIANKTREVKSTYWATIVRAMTRNFRKIKAEVRL